MGENSPSSGAELCLQHCVSFSSLPNFKEGELGGGGEAGPPPLDNDLPYQGRLLSGFLSQALALLLQMRTGV